MIRQTAKRLNYANTTATLALVLAVAGGGGAIAMSSRDSVRTKHVKDGQITARDLAGIRAVRVSTPVPDLAEDDVWSSGTTTAPCAGRERLVSGGAGPSALANNRVSLAESQAKGNSWVATLTHDTGGTLTLTATAYCLRAKPSKPINSP